MKITLRHLVSFFRNKYLLALSAFVVWMLFFDRNDFFTQQQRRRELTGLRRSKAYYQKQIAQEKTTLEELRNNPAAIEKYAREKYLMKRDNEDLYLIAPQNNTGSAQ